MLERKEKELGEEGERNTTRGTGMPVKKWKDESKSKMDECRAEWKGQRHGQARKKGENQRIKVQQGEWKVYDRGNPAIHGGRECKREKNDGKIQTWKRGERKQILDEMRGKKVQNVLWGERDNRAHVEWM
jgi:hypothetical protein